MKKNKNHRIKSISLLLLLIILLLSLSYMIKSFTSKSNIDLDEFSLTDNMNSKIVSANSYSFYNTSTYLESNMNYSTLSYFERLNMLYDNYYSLEDRIKIYLGEDIDNIGLIYYNLENNNSISINTDKIFIAASTYKVGLNFYIYYLSLIDELDLNDYIEYNPIDYEEGTGILQYEYYTGSYTIRELLDLSIIYFDNIATNMLGRYLGGHEDVRKNLYDLLNIDFQSDENLITPKIEFKILKYIYDCRPYLGFNNMLYVLTQSKYSDRLAKYVDENIVAHKIGTFDSYIHDVGIVFDDTPYIIIIYTYAIEDSEEKIANISNAIYQYNNLAY